jgi:hypothetical protein
MKEQVISLLLHHGVYDPVVVTNPSKLQSLSRKLKEEMDTAKAARRASLEAKCCCVEVHGHKNVHQEGALVANSGKSEFKKVKNLTDSQNNVFLTADGKKMIKIFHSPKNFGGMLLCPSNKVICLTGLGRSAICVQLDPTLALPDCKQVTPLIVDFKTCLTAQDIRDLQVPSTKPEDGGFYFSKGSNIMLPAPWLQDTILNADTQDPFELIPIVLIVPKEYDDAHNTVGGRAIVHADDFCSWAWGAGVGRVKESIIDVNADDKEFETYGFPVFANALPDSPTTQSTNRQEIVEHMLTYSDNSPQASPIKQKKHQCPTSCARTKLRERENMMMRRKIGQRRYTSQSSTCLKTQQQQEHQKSIWTQQKAAKIPQCRHKRISGTRSEPPI